MTDDHLSICIGYSRKQVANSGIGLFIDLFLTFRNWIRLVAGVGAWDVPTSYFTGLRSLKHGSSLFNDMSSEVVSDPMYMITQICAFLFRSLAMLSAKPFRLSR